MGVGMVYGSGAQQRVLFTPGDNCQYLETSFFCHSFRRGCYGHLVNKGQSESCSVVSNSLHPKDYTLCGILQARILEWVVFSFLRGIFPTRD